MDYILDDPILTIEKMLIIILIIITIRNPVKSPTCKNILMLVLAYVLVPVSAEAMYFTKEYWNEITLTGPPTTYQLAAFFILAPVTYLLTFSIFMSFGIYRKKGYGKLNKKSESGLISALIGGLEIAVVVAVLFAVLFGALFESIDMAIVGATIGFIVGLSIGLFFGSIIGYLGEFEKQPAQA